MAKDPACAPYVDADSRSPRTLDESLDWDEAGFEAFVGMLVGKAAVTRALTRVHEKHAPDYRALVTRIRETDDLIDQIAYRLYGLTEEDTAVVEGRGRKISSGVHQAGESRARTARVSSAHLAGRSIL